MLYEPLFPDENASVAVILMHSGANYMETLQAIALAERGFRCFTAGIRDIAMFISCRNPPATFTAARSWKR